MVKKTNYQCIRHKNVIGVTGYIDVRAHTFAAFENLYRFLKTKAILNFYLISPQATDCPRRYFTSIVYLSMILKVY